MKLLKVLIAVIVFPLSLSAQINTDRVMAIGRNALYFEDYVLSIQYFNQVINAKPYLYEPYFYRGLAKLNLDDFQGAESDCSLSIDRNPFVVSSYQVRGLARINLDDYAGAVSDYEKALKYDPENIGIWHNLTLCRMQQKDWKGAESDLEKLLNVSPKYTKAYLLRGQVYLEQKDTVKAEADYDKAISIDPYDGDAWSSRAGLRLAQSKFKDAEADYDKAIPLATKNAGNYINRALARYHQNNLRGAMNDYDMALEVDPKNFIGHYNRGLLRSQVGDDNRAIEDFNFVIKLESNNYMAIFNRAILLDKTGDYKGAIKDYTKVISAYPNFWTGYSFRAKARRKIGDLKGADADEFKVFKQELDRRYGAKKTALNSKTRKKSDKNIDDYRKIVVADNSEADNKYQSDYRGKIQDKNVKIELEPLFNLTYYEKTLEVKRPIKYYKAIETLNRTKICLLPLHITNQEAPLTEAQVKKHFASIDKYSLAITKDENNAKLRYARGLDFYLVQDFSNAIEDFTRATVLDEKFFPAYFNRAVARYKQLEYQKAEQESSGETVSVGSPSSAVKNIDYEIVRKDFDKVIELVPDFAYAYYNRANVFSLLKDYHAAIADYTKAIELDSTLAEAYYNRGLTYIYTGKVKEGISDLSKAGEEGIYSAYNIIKRYTEVKK